MLTIKTPETFKGSLTLKAQGVENSLALTYTNRTQADIKTFVSNPELSNAPEGADASVPWGVIQIVLYMVASFDDGTDQDFPLTADGLAKLESYWPGALNAIIQGFHITKAMTVEKN